MLSISDEHKESIIRLVNLVIGDTPTLTNLTDRSKVTIKLVKLIYFFENSVQIDERSALLFRCLSSEQLIENWLLDYYWEDPVMASFAIEDGLEQELSTACLLVLHVIYKSLVCLPHIVMYFNDNWTHLRQFDSQLDQMLKTDKMEALLVKQSKETIETQSGSDQTSVGQVMANEVSFRCDDCNRDFATKYKLRRHEFVHKPQSKPFKCVWEGCEQRFRASFDMRRHLVTHTGERPFECLTCGKRFTRSDKLKEHLHIHKRSEKKTNETTIDSIEHSIDWRSEFDVNSLSSNLTLFKSEFDI